MITARQVKEATRDIVDESEYNRKKLAGLLDVDYNTLCRWCNADLETHTIPPNKINDLYRITGDIRLHRLIYKDIGFICVPIPQNQTELIEFNEKTTEFFKESSEYIQETTSSVRDGRVTDAEMEKCDKEYDELIETAIAHREIVRQIWLRGKKRTDKDSKLRAVGP